LHLQTTKLLPPPSPRLHVWTELVPQYAKKKTPSTGHTTKCVKTDSKWAKNPCFGFLSDSTSLQGIIFLTHFNAKNRPFSRHLERLIFTFHILCQQQLFMAPNHVSCHPRGSLISFGKNDMRLTVERG
jgi:hypothetical protein